MKKIILALFCSISTLVYSQDTIVVTNQYTNIKETILCKITALKKPNLVNFGSISYLKNDTNKTISLEYVTYYSKKNLLITVKENKIVNSDWKYNTPGQELLIASRHYYTGVVLIGAGSLIEVWATSKGGSKFINNSFIPVKGIEIFGGLIGLLGAGFVIESHIHIKRAGILLNNNGIGLAIKLK